jgi:tRNA A37 threonylcarbamoyladenosine biosynthesis protein TsaE
VPFFLSHPRFSSAPSGPTTTLSARTLHPVGYYDCVRSNGISLIEWADMFAEVLPQNAKHIRFADLRNNIREIIVI